MSANACLRHLTAAACGAVISDEMQDRTIFQCPICRIAITQPLSPLEAERFVCLEDGKPLVPQGFFSINSKEYWNADGRFVVNLADLVSTKHHSDGRRLSGCCGLDGLDGPNLVCANGHEVGTEKSDCWMPHAAVLLETVISVNER